MGVRPWVRLNGMLNRRVVDRMLGSVLCLVMERPGISGQDVVRRFSPPLQAAHTHDLLDTLVEIECVVRQRLLKSHAPSLFSPTVEYMLGKICHAIFVLFAGVFSPVLWYCLLL